MCVKLLFMLKNENWKNYIFIFQKKVKLKKAKFSYKLPYENCEKSTVMKLNIYIISKTIQ